MVGEHVSSQRLAVGYWEVSWHEHVQQPSLHTQWASSHTQWPLHDHACVTGIVTARLHMHCKKQAGINMCVAEALVSAVPAAGAKAQLLLDLAARKPQDAQHASWMLPLAADALLNAAPPAAPHVWLQVCLCTALTHLLDVETRYHCPLTILSLDFQCRDDISEVEQTFWDR